MIKNDCFYCRKDQTLRSLMIEIAKLDVSTLYLNMDQTHKGRCIIAFDQHVMELYQLNKHDLHLFIGDISHVAKVLAQVFHPDKINYAIYGDIVSHLHVHIVPKSKQSSEWGEAFINSPDSKHYLDKDAYDEIISVIKEKLK